MYGTGVFKFLFDHRENDSSSGLSVVRATIERVSLFDATVGTEPPTTLAPPAKRLSNSSALTSLVHMPATFTLVAIASLAPLLYLVLATVLFLDILVMWRFLVPDVKPCHSYITY
jgi:hypothetical protein